MPIALTVMIHITVHYLLLLACARLSKHTPELIRFLLAAVVGGIHVLVSLLPGCGFLGKMVFRLLTIPLISMLAFGFGRQHVGKYAIYFLLCLAVDGAVGKGMLAVIFGILMLALLFRRSRGQGGVIPVAISYGDKRLSLAALRDTGNRLRDPVSGGSVMVIGAEAARYLTGLTREQLKKPLETLGAIPGLRLIPYKAVGSSGFLLGMKLSKVQIGSWRGSQIVAFAPEGLEKGSGIEALIGGSV